MGAVLGVGELAVEKRMSAADVVAELRDGMTIGIGGWGARRKPMALVREIVRSPLRDLTGRRRWRNRCPARSSWRI